MALGDAHDATYQEGPMGEACEPSKKRRFLANRTAFDRKVLFFFVFGALIRRLSQRTIHLTVYRVQHYIGRLPSYARAVSTRPHAVTEIQLR